MAALVGVAVDVVCVVVIVCRDAITLLHALFE